MSYGQCEYTLQGWRCEYSATVIVSSEGGKDPQRLCSEHEAIVAEESFYEEARERDRQNMEGIKEVLEEAERFSIRALRDRIVELETRMDVLETKNAIRQKEFLSTLVALEALHNTVTQTIKVTHMRISNLEENNS